jgi:hypothetical protein
MNHHSVSEMAETQIGHCRNRGGARTSVKTPQYQITFGLDDGITAPDLGNAFQVAPKNAVRRGSCTRFRPSNRHPRGQSVEASHYSIYWGPHLMAFQGFGSPFPSNQHEAVFLIGLSGKLP